MGILGSLGEVVGVAPVLALTLVASGTLACFFGYRLFRFVLGATGFLAGGSLGWLLVASAGYEHPVLAVACFLGAVLGAVGMFSLFSLGVFLFGCGLGLLTAAVALSVAGVPFNVLTASLAALVGGLVTILSKRLLIVASTAMTGAWSVLCGVCFFLRDLDPMEIVLEPHSAGAESGAYYLLLATWSILGVGGIAVQLQNSRKRKKRRSR